MAELAAIRRSNETSLPDVASAWTERLCRRLKIDLTIRPRGRPRKRTQGEIIGLTPLSAPWLMNQYAPNALPLAYRHHAREVLQEIKQFRYSFRPTLSRSAGRGGKKGMPPYLNGRGFTSSASRSAATVSRCSRSKFARSWRWARRMLR